MLWLMVMVVTATPAAAQGPWSVFVGRAPQASGAVPTPRTPRRSDPHRYKPTPTTRFHAGVARSSGARACVRLSLCQIRARGIRRWRHQRLSPALTLYDLRLLGSYAIAGWKRVIACCCWTDAAGMEWRCRESAPSLGSVARRPSRCWFPCRAASALLVIGKPRLGRVAVRPADARRPAGSKPAQSGPANSVSDVRLSL